MPLRSTIIDPGLYERLAAFYPSVATIKARATADQAAPTSFGEPSGSYEPVIGLGGIQCRVMRVAVQKTQERRTGAMVVTENRRAIDLAGYYPRIETRMIATVDGADYDIVTVFHDSQQRQTQLMAEMVTT